MLDEEMLVIVDVGVEIAPLRVDDDLPQKAGTRELMQGVVNGRQRNTRADLRGLFVQRLCRKVTVPTREKEARELDALTRRAQTGVTQTRRHLFTDFFTNLLAHGPVVILPWGPVPLTLGLHVC